MKPEPAGDEFAAFLGIDWADAQHDICFQAANAARRESSVLPHRPDRVFGVEARRSRGEAVFSKCRCARCR